MALLRSTDIYGSLYVQGAQTTGTLNVIDTVTLSGQLISTVITGTAPFVVASTTMVTNLNAQYLNGQLGSYYAQDSTVVKLSGDQTIAGIKTFSSTITGSISGNAGTVTNGVYTNGSYADPAWITSLSKSKVGLSNVENTALSTWAGTTNITTLGTIGTGTWQGGVISPTYGGTGVNNASRTLTINTNSGTLSFTNASTTLTIANNASVSGTNTGDQTTISGNAGSATLIATTQKSDNINYQIPFVPSVTAGNQALHTDSVSSITFNPSTNTLSTPNLTVSGNLTVNNVEMINTSNGVVFEGSTNDGIKTTLTATDPTANRSITLPNNSGMVALTGDIGNGTMTITAGTGLSNGGSFTANQSGNTSVTINHSNSITASNVGPTANATLAFGGTFTVPQVHYDAQGHLVTNTTNRTMTMPATPVTSFSGGTTGLLPSTATTGAITLSGTLIVGNGGTGATSFTVGEVLIGNGTNAISTLSRSGIDSRSTFPAAQHSITTHSATAWRMFFSNATTTAIQELALGTVGTYLRSGGASANPTFAQIAYSEISGTPTIGNGTLTMNTSGSGISGSTTFTANQTGASTFTVTSNATTAATASTIVLRDADANIRTNNEVQATNFTMRYDSTSKSVKFVFV
jgi:hypothetical protein